MKISSPKAINWTLKQYASLRYSTLLYARCDVKPISFDTAHSGGNDRFCARLKTDISASNSGLRGRTRSCLTFLERGRQDESKMVRHDLRWPWRPKLKAEMSVFNLAQKRSFPPLCAAFKLQTFFKNCNLEAALVKKRCSGRTPNYAREFRHAYEKCAPKKVCKSVNFCQF
jgi:hypothetical protein